MAVQVPPELQTPEVILRAMGSAMAGDTRSPARKLLDLLLGGNPAERMGGVAPMRIGVMPGREKIASDIIKRGLKEPWFHGTSAPRPILEGAAIDPRWVGRWADLLGASGRNPGFSMERLGETAGLRLGEPAGVSLTRSPEVARKFGDVLRVGVDIPPSSVGQFVDPEMQRLLREAYTKAGATPLSVGMRSPLAPHATTMGELLQAGVGKQTLMGELPVSGTASFNKAMSDYLRTQGVEGIAYNPRRWAEYEMRVLDPSKAVPLGAVPMDMPAWTKNVTPGNPVMSRYLYGREMPQPGGSPTYTGLVERLRQQYLTAPEFPVLLRDVLGITGAD